jgi:hypothetical protein
MFCNPKACGDVDAEVPDRAPRAGRDPAANRKAIFCWVLKQVLLYARIE